MAQFQIAPGVDGYMAARQMMNQEDSQKMGALMQLMQAQRMQQQDALAAEERPLKMELLRAGIAEKAATAENTANQRAAQGALSRLAMTGGYTGPQAEGVPTAVAPNDAEALRMVREADARGQPMGVNVPNPGNVRALTSMAFPAEFGRAQAQAMFREPKAAPTPRQNIVPVTGGYLQPNAAGGMEFVRTQQPGEGRAPPAPIQVKDANGNVKLYDQSGNLIRDLGTVGAPNAANLKATAARQKMNTELDQAITELTNATKDGGLIDSSTGSGAGALVDTGAAFFGKATPGSIAVGQMKPIFDLVLKMVPRFEGPQSDKDTATYKEAAGELANPAVPNERKKAAGKEILRLMKARKGQFTSNDLMGAEAETGGAPVTDVRSQADKILGL